MKKEFFTDYYNELPVFYRFLKSESLVYNEDANKKLPKNAVFLEEMKEYNSTMALCFSSMKPISKMLNDE